MTVVKLARIRRVVLALGFFVGLALSGGSWAAPAAVALTAADTADLHRIEAYLDAIKTLRADFQQFNPDGSTSTGKVWLSRPGKMRFEYQPPVRMTIISNGEYVSVEDRELNNVSFYPVDSTPAWFLLREGIKLSGDVTVTKFERGPESLRVTAVQTKDSSTGAITLIFSDEPLALNSWSVLDAQGRSTTITLNDLRQGGSFSADLFKLPANKVATPDR